MAEVASGVSIIVGFMSIGLAAFAIWIARSSEKESRENYRQTRDLLAEIDKRTTVTEALVSQSQRQILDTLIGLVSPKPVSDPASERDAEMGLRLFQSMLQSNSPTEVASFIQAMSQLSDRPDQPGT